MFSQPKGKRGARTRLWYWLLNAPLPHSVAVVALQNPDLSDLWVFWSTVLPFLGPCGSGARLPIWAGKVRPTVRRGKERCSWVGHLRFVVVCCQLDRMAGGVVDFLLPQIRLDFATPAFDFRIFVFCGGGGHGNGIVENSKILPARSVSHRCEEVPRCSVSIFVL